MTRSALCATVAALSLVAVAAQAGQRSASDPAPAADATITFRGRTAAIGVGFAWGASSGRVQGQDLPVRVEGFVLGGLGTASLEGSERSSVSPRLTI